MKANVIKYKQDGNTVTTSYMELELYAENVYISLCEKDRFGDDSLDLFYVVCCVSDVYFTCGRFVRRILDEEGKREASEAFCRNWIANTLLCAKSGGFVNLIAVRVFESLGLDTTPLLQAREDSKALREKERLAEEEQEKKRKAEEERAHQQYLDEQKRAFLRGECISSNTFLEIAGRDGFDIHIRTKGTFRASVQFVTRDGGIYPTARIGKRAPNFSGCHKAIYDYLEFLKQNN